ncbi:PTS sugar transporter subunit IIC [Coprobacillus cateniformis]|uniref:PTS sugar transporter subunit IIC n=1 Tax=Coprobacillus cateniformis TaxID=100884 RepID=UPI00241CE06D|nr:PTS transporter subunit EIIC [Coprobacillus cateniformis]
MEKTKNILEKFQNKLNEVLLPIAEKIGQQRHLSAIKDSMAILIPLTIIGGLSILLAQPPVNPETMKGSNFFFQFLLSWYNWAQQNINILMIPYRLTIGIISIYVSVSVAYRLAEKYNLPKLETSFTALLTFLCVAGAPQVLENGTFMPIANLGATGMFIAIIISLLTVEITYFFIKHDITIKMPDSVPPNIASPFRVLFPLIFNVVFFILLNTICENLLNNNLCNILLVFIQPLLNAADSLPSILFLLLLAQTFWFLGIHGDNMIGAIITPITTANIALNLEAYNAGQEMTHIFAGSFQSIWAGWIMQWAMLIVMIIFAKSQHLKKLSRLAPVSTLFNVNEPLVFGVPTVLNTIIIIPQLIIIVFNISVAYFCTAFGIIGKSYMILPWTTPVPLFAFLTTMDIKALFLWLILLVIDIFIMIPFVKTYDNNLLNQEKETIE